MSKHRGQSHSAPAHGVYRRTYTIAEVVATFCRLSPCGENLRRLLLELGERYPLWVRRRVPLAALAEQPYSRDRVGRYAAKRKRGSRFPPVIATPTMVRGYDLARDDASGRGWRVEEGNHRVAAARAAGDRYIDAFVPVRRG